jgi:hypothetical protein
VREYTYYPGVDVRYQGHTYYYEMEEPGHVLGLSDSTKAAVNRYSYTA